jgi:hypothetical protein
MSSPNWLVLLLVMSASISPCAALEKYTWKMGKWTITKYLERFNEFPAEAMIVVDDRFKKDAFLDTVGVVLTLVNRLLNTETVKYLQDGISVSERQCLCLHGIWRCLANINSFQTLAIVRYGGVNSCFVDFG